MKKLLALSLSLLMIVLLVACGGDGGTSTPSSTPDASGSTPAPSTDGYEIAMITDIGNIDDKSFNQGTWEGVQMYGTANNITHQYYKPTEQSDDAYLQAIDLAIQGGAKIIVTPGYLFENPIGTAQAQYPDVHFILIDGNPTGGAAENAVGITYAEEQSGYLAGYAAVKDGYTSLGFMGGMAVPAVVRFGFGYVQGANDAAAELGITVDMKYFYTGGFEATPEAQAMAASWYQGGTEVIFGCGGSVGNSVFAAAEAAGAKAIGVDVDQSAESETIITSAIKGLRESVNLVLGQYYAGNFPGGEAQTLGAADDAVGIPMETSRFETFTQADYDAIFGEIAAGNVCIPKDSDSTSASPADIAAGFANVNLDVVTQ
ncbi:BMP family ABC transporter substrate-binding protein [Ruminococcaceae bacterium OttesenSCG-928-O06]|nr:BMP family ABC transporter substrate-binding protein [Ruminococcaceae bacterium OttesenSCG-928-O06]